MEDTHLLGIGYKVVGDGEREFAKSSKRVRDEGSRTRKSLSALDAVSKGLSDRFNLLNDPIGKAKNALVATATAATVLAAAYGGALNSTIAFESALIGVGKTADIQGAALRSLGGEVDQLSRKIPVATDELLGIAQAAGQLGVAGASNIIKFTETVALLGQASDLQGEAAATALARILNVTGEAVDSVGTLASVIVALGNSFAATESQIARHTGEVARATASYELGSAQAAAIGTTLAAFGVQAELSGSAVGRSFRVIESAVKSGGEQMAALTRLTRTSAAEIADAFGNDPAQAFNLFLQGVRKVQEENGNVAESLKSVGLEGEEVLKVIPVLSKQYDVLARAQATASQESRSATALTQEAARAAESLQSQVSLLRNSFSSAVRVVGGEVSPAYRQVVVDLRQWIDANHELFEQVGSVGAGALSALSGAVTHVGDAVKVLTVLTLAGAAAWATYLAVPLVIQLAAWVRGIAAMTAALRLSTVALIGVSTAVEATQAALTRLWAVIAANPAAIAAVAVAALVAGLATLYLRAKEAREEHEALLRSISSGTATMDEETRALVDQERGLRDQIAQRRELQDEMRESAARVEELKAAGDGLREALELGDLEAYATARDRLRELGVEVGDLAEGSSALGALDEALESASNQAERSADRYEDAAQRILDMQAKLGENAELLVTNLAAARMEERGRLDDLTSEIQEVERAMAAVIAAGQTSPEGGAGSFEFMRLQERKAELLELVDSTETALESLGDSIARNYDRAQESVAKLFREGQFDRAGKVLRAFMSPEEVEEQLRFQRAIQEAGEKQVKALRAQEQAQQRAAQATEEQRKKYEAARQSIRDSTRDLDLLVGTIGLEGAARSRAIRDLEVEKRTRSAAVGLTAAQRQEIEKLTRAQVDAEQRLAGLQALDELRAQREELLRVAEAYAVGRGEAEKVRRQLQIEEEARRLTADAAAEQVREIELLASVTANLREVTSAQAQAADLERENAALSEIIDAYQRGTVAVRELREEQEARQKVEEATSGLLATEADLTQKLTDRRNLLAAASSGLVSLSGEQANQLREEIALISEQIGLSEEQRRQLELQIRTAARLQDASRTAEALAGMRQEVEFLRVQKNELDKATDAQLANGEAVKKAAFELEVQRRILAAMVQEGSPAATEIRKLTAEEWELTEGIRAATEAAEEMGDRWRQVGEGIAEVLSMLGSEFAGIAGSITDAAMAYRDFRASGGDAQGNRGIGAFFSSEGGQQASAAFGGAVGNFIGANLSGGGTSGFGGAMSGNYAKEGAELGNAMGGGWTTFALAVVGGLIEKSGDVAELVIEGSENASAHVKRAEGGLAEFAANFKVAIDSWISDFEFLTGEALNADLAGIKITIEDEIITVDTASGTAGFRELGDALAFVVERLLMANEAVEGFGEGLGENAQRLIEGLTGPEMRGDIEDLSAAFRLAVQADDLKANAQASEAVRQSIREITAQREEELRLARAYGLNMADVIRLTDRRLAQLREEIKAAADGVLGISNNVNQLKAIAGSMEAFGRQTESEAASRRASAQAARDRAAQIEAELAGLATTTTTAGAAVTDAAQQTAQGANTAAGSLRGAGRGAREAATDVAAYGEATGTAREEAVKTTYEISELARELQIAQEEAAALEASIGDIPSAFDPQEIVDLWEAGAAQAGLALIGMLQQVRGDSFAAAEAEELRGKLAILQLAAQISAVEALLAATDLLTDATRGFLTGIVQDANEVLQGLQSGELTLGGGVRGRGGGGRRQQREDELRAVREELQRLRDAAFGIPESVSALRASLADFDEWIASARKLGVAEEELAQARRDSLKLLTDEFLDPFLETIQQAEETDFETNLRHLTTSYADSLAEAWVLAEARARAFGTSVRDEFDALSDVVTGSFAQDFRDAILPEIDRLREAGDVKGLLDLIGQLRDFDISSLPPELQDAFREVRRELAAQIFGAVSDVRSGDIGPDADVEPPDLSGIQGDLDLAAGLTDAQVQLRDINERYVEIIDQARKAGASESELAQIRQGQVAAIGKVRDAILSSVQSYLDQAQGIGEFERRLIDLQGQFADARKGLADVDKQLASVESSAKDFAGDLALLDAAQRRATQQIGIDFLGSLEALGAAVPIEVTLELARVQWELARAEALAAATALAAAGAFDGLSISLEDVIGIIQNADFDASTFAPRGPGAAGGRGGRGGSGPVASSREEANEASRLLDEIRNQLKEWRDLLSGQFELEARALRERMEELRSMAAQAQAESPFSTLAQAWLGSLDVSAEELQGRLDALALNQQLPRTLITALQQYINEIAGVDEEIAEAFSIARGRFIDDALREFEDLGKSSEQLEFESLIRNFDDLRAAFSELDATTEELSRLESAQAAAIADVWDEILGPLEGGEAETFQGRIAGINERFAELLSLADQYGGDLERIEAARQRAIEEFWDEALRPLQDFQEGLEMGAQGGLSPEERLQAAQAQFNELSRAALQGDIEAAQRLPGAIDALLGEARDFYGTGPAYQALFRQVNDLVAQVLAFAPQSAALEATDPFMATPEASPDGGEGGPATPFAPLPPPPSAEFGAGADRQGAAIERLIQEMQEDREESRRSEDSEEETREVIRSLLETIGQQADRIEELAGTVEDLVLLIRDREAA